MSRPTEQSVDLEEGAVSVALGKLRMRPDMLRGITGNWAGMDAYWRWVTMVYGPEVVDRFGDLSIVEAGLLPMGMVLLFREKRVKW